LVVWWYSPFSDSSVLFIELCWAARHAQEHLQIKVWVPSKEARDSPVIYSRLDPLTGMSDTSTRHMMLTVAILEYLDIFRYIQQYTIGYMIYAIWYIYNIYICVCVSVGYGYLYIYVRFPV
jgi:hypothetical protein